MTSLILCRNYKTAWLVAERYTLRRPDWFYVVGYRTIMGYGRGTRVYVYDVPGCPLTTPQMEMRAAMEKLGFDIVNVESL